MTGGRRYEFGIADRLRRARELAGFDQRGFEEASGISRTTISNYEQGKYGKRGPGRVYLSIWATTTGFDLEPDLFWALRGGGGNFGVVTSFTFKLNDVSRFVGGPTFWAVEQGDEVLKAYREFLPSAPRRLTGFFAYAQVPPAPPFPEELYLRPVCGVIWGYVGDEEGAREAMAPLLESVPEPLLHGVAPMPHAAMQGAFDALYPKDQQWCRRAEFVDENPDAAVEVHQRLGWELPASYRVCLCTRSTGPHMMSIRPTPPGAIGTRTGARCLPAWVGAV